jgi:protein-disulfide isomerase
MNMVNFKAKSLIILLIGVMLLVACGGEATEPSQEDVLNEVEANSAVVTGDDGTGTVNTAPTATNAPLPTTTQTESPTTAPAVNADPDAAETNADGIPVGFTEEGYPYIGYLDAPVVIEEFSDFQCPFCARFHAQTLPTLLQNDIANGDVLFMYVDFPLSIHPQAPAAGNAAQCAGAQSAAAYWDMHDLLFESLGQWSGAHANDFFKNLATRIPELDQEAFAKCVDNGDYDQTVQTNFNTGRDRGVGSTPHFFVNGTSLVGAQPLPAFQQAIALALSGEAPPPTAAAAAAPPVGIAPTPVTLTEDFAFAYGDPNAPVKIVEFTDYQCPFCNRHVSEVFPTVLEELINTGRVYYQIKDLPLESIHPQARLAHNAARCAGEQEAYSEMHDVLFAQQSQWGNANAEQIFVNMATEMGLDTAQFSDCLTNRKYDAQVQANLQEAASLGANGTPFFFVDGYPLSGARPIEHFQIAVGMAEEGNLGDAFVRQPDPTPIPAGPVNVNAEGGLAIGNPDAPVTIIEFTDYQCPFCQRYHEQTYPLILENYIETGQVYYIVKDFPLTSIHPQAPLAAEAVHCANEQEAHVEMGDLLFSNMSQWSGNPNHGEVFKGYAGNNLGLDADAFGECLDSRKYQGLVASNQQDGIGVGVTGTPAFFINGTLLSGAQPFNAFVQAIEIALNAQ